MSDKNHRLRRLLGVVLAASLLVGNVWTPEPRGQEYVLRHGDAVLFWVVDERPPAFGQVVYLWGYVPTIYSGGRTFQFCDVQWCYGEL